MRIPYLLLISLLTFSCTNTNNENGVSVEITEPTKTNKGKIEGRIYGCGFDKASDQELVALYEPSPREIDQINSILKYSGINSNFKVYSADIKNAIATIINNERYIIYDKKLLSNIDQQTGNYWSSMSILAHEIGHHLSGHTFANKGSNPSDELEADKYSGFVLYKLGATLNQAKSAMEKLGSETKSATHPAKNRRLDAIEKGWNEANETRYNSAIPPPPQNLENIEFGTEFNTENLIDEESYYSLKSKNGHGSWVSGINEGIITEVLENRTQFQIFITKLSSDDTENNYRKVNQKILIELYPPQESREWSRAQIGRLFEIMVPGRRIKFAYGSNGGTAEHFYFAYIKYMPAN